MMKGMWMRFMMVVIRKGYETVAADAAPGAEAVARMMEYTIDRSLRPKRLSAAIGSLRCVRGKRR
jgi:hypothetical protein